MKVYINFQGKEYRSDINELANKSQFILLKLIKYQIMWALRNLENEIAEEGGAIIIEEDSDIQTKSFSPELTKKIQRLILEIKFE